MTDARESRAFRPVILGVDEDPGGLERIERELRKRYEADYAVVCVGSAEGGLERLRDLAAAGEEVAVLVAGLFVLIGAEPRTEWLPEEVERDERAT